MSCLQHKIKLASDLSRLSLKQKHVVIQLGSSTTWTLAPFPYPLLDHCPAQDFSCPRPLAPDRPCVGEVLADGLVLEGVFVKAAVLEGVEALGVKEPPPLLPVEVGPFQGNLANHAAGACPYLDLATKTSLGQVWGKKQTSQSSVAAGNHRTGYLAEETVTDDALDGANPAEMVGANLVEGKAAVGVVAKLVPIHSVVVEGKLAAFVTCMALRLQKRPHAGETGRLRLSDFAA